MSNTNVTELAERISQKIQDSIELNIDSTLLSAEEILSSSDVSEFLQSANDLQIGAETAYKSSFNEEKSDRVALALSDKIARNKNYFFKRNREIETPFVLQIKKSDDNSIHARFEVESKLGNAEIFMVNRDVSDDDVYGIADGSFLYSYEYREVYETLFGCSPCEVLSKIIDKGARYGFSLPITDEEAYQIQESEDVDRIDLIIQEAEERGMLDIERAVMAVNIRDFDMVDLTSTDLSNSASCEFTILIES